MIIKIKIQIQMEIKIKYIGLSNRMELELNKITE